MSRSFFLATLLPRLNVGAPPSISFDDLMTLYRENLTLYQWKKVRLLLLYVDLKNVEKVLKGFPIDPRGTLSEKELKEAIEHQKDLPPLLLNFFQEVPTPSKQLELFPKVFALYFKDMEKRCRGFLREYFQFERNWRIVFAGYRSKKLGVDLTDQLQYEDPLDPIVVEVLAQKEAPQFEFPFEFAHLQETLKKIGQNPREQYQWMAELQFEWIEEKMERAPFSFDYFLGYLLQLMIVEDVAFLDLKRGGTYLNEMMKDVV